MRDFLTDLPPRNWSTEAFASLGEGFLYIGQGTNAIEVAVTDSPNSPNSTLLKQAWKNRRGGRPTPVLVVIRHGDKADLCGADGEDPPVFSDVNVELVERICQTSLNEPNRHAALRFLDQALSTLDNQLPGLNNKGLLAFHELLEGVPRRNDWANANRKAQSIIHKRNKDLLEGLGYTIESLDNLTFLLREGTKRTALAILLNDSENPESSSNRFNNISPVSYALKKADDESLQWAIMVQGNRLRLYTTSTDVGVSRRGRTETYLECQPHLLPGHQLGYLWLLFSADALSKEGSLKQIIDSSGRFSGDLAVRLRERIYGEVVPFLAKGLSDEQKLTDPTPQELAFTYEMALTVLFRLLFIAYAEDRDLLPYRTNENYRRRSLKNIAMELSDAVNERKPVSSGNHYWQDINNLFRAVSEGNSALGVPAYSGDLFSQDPNISLSSATLWKLSLPNNVFESALRGCTTILYF